MFGREVQPSTASPGVAGPPSDRPKPRVSEQRQRAVPAWLLPWLMPLFVVVSIVVIVVAPVYVVAGLGVVVLAGLGRVLFRVTRGQDYDELYDLTRTDRLLKRRNRYEMTRNDRFDRDRRSK
jgi:hypothetical protein